MHVEPKINIHNRFDIHVDNIETGEHKEFTSYNIVLNSMYGRICNLIEYFKAIAFGSGTGTLDPSRTTLFSYLGIRIATNVELIKAAPVSSWKRKIVLNPEEFVGSVITEVGIASTESSNALVTHSLLKDSEGNPISITKTATDVVTIYATVFVTLSESDPTLKWIELPNNNALINFLIGNTAIPGVTYGTIYDAFVGGYALANGAAVSWTPDIPNKKLKSNLTRIPTTQGNGYVAKAFGATNIFMKKIPSAGLFEGQPLVDVPIGTGDGVKTKFTLPSTDVIDNTIVVKNNSNVVAHAIENIPYTLSRLASPAELPTSTGFASAISGDGKVMAVGTNASPYLHVYSYANDKISVRKTPVLSGTPTINDLDLNYDGSVLAIATNSSKPLVYDWDGTEYIQRPLPDTILTTTQGVALANDGNTLAACSTSMSPYIGSWDWVDGAWVSRSNPVNLPVNFVYGCDITPDGLVMVIGGDNSTGGMVYDWNGSIWIKRGNNLNNTVMDVAVSDDGLTVALALYSLPYLAVYDWNGSTWIKRTDPVVAAGAAQTYGITISKDKKTFIIVSATSPRIHVYDWNDNLLVKRPDPRNIPAGNGRSIDISDDNQLIICGHTNTPFFTLYKCNKKTDVILETPPDLNNPITASYTVDGVHKTDQFVIDSSFSIQFGEGV